MKAPRRDGQRNWQPTSIPLTINELLRPSLLSRYSMMMMLLLLLLLSITMRPTAAIIAPTLPQHYHHQARSNYHEPNTEAFAGLAGGYASTSIRQNYYGAADGGPATMLLDVDGSVGDLAAEAAPASATYANYEPKAVSALGSTTSGFMPATTTALYNYNNYNTNNNNNNENRLQSEGKIDFVINTANYDVNEEQEQHQQQHHHHQSDVYYPNYSYQPGAPQAQQHPFHDYHIEQFPNYHQGGVEHQRQKRVLVQQPRQVNDDSSLVYREQRHDFRLPLNRQQRAKEPQQQQQQQQQRRQQEDQQLLYSQPQNHITDLHNDYRNSLPPITTSVHHTASSSKAIAGLPLNKHIEFTKQVPITHYQQQLVPFKQQVEIRVPRPVISAIPKPIPIKIPVSKTVAVPQLQEVKIPIEKVKPFAVERRIPFIVERRVPYNVEKAIATPFYYPYPVKVPIVRTVVHKQRPPHTLSTPGFGSFETWSNTNQLLG